MAQVTEETQAALDAAIEQAAEGLAVILEMTVAKAREVVVNIVQQKIRRGDYIGLPELRGYALGEDPEVATWTLADALEKLDPAAQGIGQAFLDYMAQYKGLGLQPTLGGGLGSPKCNLVRAFLEKAGAAYFAANPTLSFTATVRTWAINAANNGGNAVNTSRNPETQQLLRACNEAARWLLE